MGNQTQEHDANVHLLLRARAWSLQTHWKRVCLLISKQRAPICAEEFAVAMFVCVFSASERVYGAPAPSPFVGPPHSLHSPCPPTRTPHAGTAHAMRRKATSFRVITRQRRFCLRRSWLLTVSVYGPPVPARSPHAHRKLTNSCKTN